ncbi:S9 family peptidase [uncultured Algimonas sp.]|uniref:S9 family peptidase n=1 Tax=uncultured Algimonas sp. TaxID=1547920 RepID=UPI002623753E|nr:S9 family peptidase [uncultured Algimonas sp.]
MMAKPWLQYLLGLVVLPASALAETSPVPMSPVDFIEMPRLSDPVPSPDGRYVAYLRSQTDWSENDIFDRIVLMDRTTGRALPIFAPSEETEDMSAPDWMPDSRRFIVVLEREIETSGDEKEEKEGLSDEQAWIYDIGTHRLERLTAHPTDIGNVQVAPDGSGFYFTARKPRDRVLQTALDDDFAIRPYESERPFEVWFFDLETRASRKIISGDFYTRGYDLSEDGSQILHMRAPAPTGDARHDGELWVQDVASGASRQLTRNTHAENSARLSPDNRSFAYIATVNAAGEGYYEDNLFIHRIGEVKPTLALPDLPMEVVDVAWGADAETIFLLGNKGLRTQLYRYDVRSGALTPLTLGDHVVKDWHFVPQSGVHAFVRQDAESPGEVYTLDTDRGVQRLTNEYADWPSRYRLPKQEPFAWTGRDGVPIEGLLVYPVDYRPGLRFPLVTVTHGGPRSSSQFGSWNTSRGVPVLAGQGYGVLLPNHRGGTGYGDDFVRDMVGGYFTNAGHDTMRGIDAAIAAGLADPDALIKMGWSAGGHMTNWLITQTDRFKAAASGAGAADWISMYGESDIRHNRTPWFGASPWDADADLDVFREHSPLTFSARVTTPTLFYNGARDVRVPPTQSIMMYRAVQATGTPTRLYLAPGQPHGFRKPGFQLFKVNTDLAWFAEHLGRPIPEPVMPDGR